VRNLGKNKKEDILKEKYEKREFLKILIDRELDLNYALRIIENSIRLTPLYGGGLNVDGKYEVILTFDSKQIHIDKIHKTIEVKKI